MREPILVLTGVVLFMGGCGRTVPRSPPQPSVPAPASTPQPPPPQTTPSPSPSP
jgi:hypothetical protein